MRVATFLAGKEEAMQESSRRPHLSVHCHCSITTIPFSREALTTVLGALHVCRKESLRVDDDSDRSCCWREEFVRGESSACVNSPWVPDEEIGACLRSRSIAAHNPQTQFSKTTNTTQLPPPLIRTSINKLSQQDEQHWQ